MDVWHGAHGHAARRTAHDGGGQRLGAPPEPRSPPKSPPPLVPFGGACRLGVTSAPPLVPPSGVVGAGDAGHAEPRGTKQYETLYDGAARVALYGYNDILIRKGTAELDDAACCTSSLVLVIDGWSPLGPDAQAPPPTVAMYGASPHYLMLQMSVGELSSAAAYRLPEGEALRHIKLLRELPPGEAPLDEPYELGMFEA
jgi:hypothetical protein